MCAFGFQITHKITTDYRQGHCYLQHPLWWSDGREREREWEGGKKAEKIKNKNESGCSKRSQIESVIIWHFKKRIKSKTFFYPQLAHGQRSPKNDVKTSNWTIAIRNSFNLEGFKIQTAAQYTANYKLHCYIIHHAKSRANQEQPVKDHKGYTNC